ncbi:MAG: hypothetical protein ACREHV_03050 [Rhizomicrobium sp.]
MNDRQGTSAYPPADEGSRARLTDFVDGEKLRTLKTAIAQKAKALIGELRFELESRLAALRMPIDRLSRSLLKFDQATIRFKSERNASSDLIAGDRKRLLGDLDVEAEQLKRVPYWVTQPHETLDVLPPGTFETLLPGSHRRHRMRSRLLSRLDEILRRNVRKSALVDVLNPRGRIPRVRSAAEAGAIGNTRSAAAGNTAPDGRIGGMQAEVDALGAGFGRLMEIQDALGAIAANCQRKGP